MDTAQVFRGILIKGSVDGVNSNICNIVLILPYLSILFNPQSLVKVEH